LIPRIDRVAGTTFEILGHRTKAGKGNLKIKIQKGEELEKF